MQTQNKIRIKPMGKWITSPYRRDGYNNCHNSDSVGSIYISYDVTRGASVETDNRFFLFIQFPGKNIKEEVNSFEDGMQKAEEYRKEFWEEFYAQFSTKIIDKGD